MSRFSLGILLLALSATVLPAENDLRVGGEVFYGVGDEWEDGYGLTGRVTAGFFSEHFLDLELSRFFEETIRSDTEIDSTTIPLILSYRYMPELDGDWQIYVGGGGGVAFTDWGTLDIPGGSGFGRESDDVVFAWQLTTGVEYSLTDSIILKFNYRWLKLEQVSVREETGDVSGLHMIGLGADYRF